MNFPILHKINSLIYQYNHNTIMNLFGEDYFICITHQKILDEDEVNDHVSVDCKVVPEVFPVPRRRNRLVKHVKKPRVNTIPVGDRILMEL